MAHAKIVVTLGPASDSLETVTALIKAGAQIFRLNASHGPWEQHQQRITTVREAERLTGVPVGILLDLQGPKIRLGKFAEGKCLLQTGARFTITTEEILGDDKRASTTYKQFATDVRRGDRVLLNDGAVTLRVVSTDGVSVDLDVVSGGPIGNQKGINLPGVKVSAPSLTEKDLADLAAGLAAGVDYVAMSFVRNSADVRAVRDHMGSARVPIIAKIEKPEAVHDIDAILDVTNGIMVARGDLGVEVPPENVPAIQKHIIRRAAAFRKPVITATQMLESMIDNPRPTRAEVSDVANAVYDGTDAVMLSGESAMGAYPVLAVEMMAKIVAEAERNIALQALEASVVPPRTRTLSVAETICEATAHAAHDLDLKGIAIFTESGATAIKLSKYKPDAPIYAFSSIDVTINRLNLLWGVTPIRTTKVQTIESMVEVAETLLEQHGHARKGDIVAIVAGTGTKSGSTNFLRLHKLGDRIYRTSGVIPPSH